MFPSLSILPSERHEGCNTEKTAVTVLHLHKNVAEYLSATFMQGTKTTNCFSLLSARGEVPFHTPAGMCLPESRERWVLSRISKPHPIMLWECLAYPDHSQHGAVPHSREQKAPWCGSTGRTRRGNVSSGRQSPWAESDSVCRDTTSLSSCSSQRFILHLTSPVWALWSPD